MIKKCAVCGKEFDAEPTQRKFCSSKCQEIKHRQQNREWQRKNRNKHESMLTCRLCGVSLDNAHFNTKYCDSCRKKVNVQRNKKSNKKRTCNCNPPCGCFNCSNSDCNQDFPCTKAENEFYEMAELPHGGTIGTRYILRIDDVICSLKGR